MGATRPHNPAARGELLGATAPWQNRSRTKKNKPALNTKLRILPKRELKLEVLLKKLDGYAAIILDDLGYVQQTREEMEVLFTFLAERYERRSVMISSNLVFSRWERIFQDPMTAMAAVDRLVHHSVILEFGGESQRGPKNQKGAKPTG